MSDAMLPPPDQLGLPTHFTAWRKGQVDAVLQGIDSPQRFCGLVLPTGFGKSLVYMAIAHLTGKRTVILTATKALQRQLQQDFLAIKGTTLVQGQRAYLCKAMEPGGELYQEFREPGERRETFCDHGPCHLGVDCSLKAAGCGYFDAVRSAQGATIVITNYAWWLTLVNQPVIPLRPELLVCDEAHAAPDILADAIGATLTHEQVREVLNEKLPTSSERNQQEWVEWAKTRGAKLAQWLEGTQPRTREAVLKVRRGQNVLYALRRIGAIDPNLLLLSDEDKAVRFDVIWAAAFAEKWLFRGVPKVVMTSATMTKKTAELVGVVEKSLDFYEAGDGFPVNRRPIYVSPARQPPFGDPLRVDFRMSPDMDAAWLEHVDKILDGRKNRKAIIHTISYQRRDRIIARSRHRERMLTHGRHDTALQIAKFKAAGPGAILVSPSVTTGYDFPYQECELQIVAKIPFPDGRDPVTKTRSLVDKRYPAHLAMQELVQAVGRGMRATDDQCETFIVDAHAYWFLKKHADLAPRWFRRALRKLNAGEIPSPPPPLSGRGR